MLLAVQKDKAKAVLDGYYKALANVGYVKRPVVKRFLAWLFLVDFVELVYEHLTDADYNLINKALICIFNSGFCLLPYGALTRSFQKIVVGPSQYMGTFNLRITEDEKWRDAEEGDLFRAAEVEEEL